MKISSWIVAAIALLAAMPAWAADDAAITRLTLCQDSWRDWTKTNPARWENFGKTFRADFSHEDNHPYWTPNKDKSVLGLRIVQAFPDSVGMGVGFSLLVAAPIDKTRKVFEKALGKPLGKCEASDGMHSCELEIAQERTFTLMAEDDEKDKTLVGCYYYYEK